MAKRWMVNVLEEDFEHGVPSDSNRCAVKRAVARDIPGATRVEVDLQTIRFSLNGERHVFLTPWSVSDYVIAYDAGDEDELHPFSFTLRPSHVVGSKVQRKVFTEEGAKVDAARNRVRKAKAKKEKAAAVAIDPEVTAAERAYAKATLDTIDEQITEREHELAEIRAEAKASDKPKTRTVNPDAPRPPRKAKTRTRVFGARVYRVNQGEGRQHYVHGAVDVDTVRG